MADTERLAGAATKQSISARPNPFTVTLVSVGLFAFVLALMLWTVVIELTDYPTYDIEQVAAVNLWINILIGLGIASLVGAVVIAGVRWELCRTDLPK